MTSLVAYIERGESGLAIRAIRLVDARAESRWTAPPLSPTLANPDGARAAIAAAADWLRDRLAQADAPPGALRICLDLGGGRCAWLTAPSLDHALVKAAASAAAMDASASSAQPGAVGGSSGGGLGMAWAPGFGEVDADLTVEALNGIEAPPSDAPAPDRKRRLAVLAIPDAPARVLVDELDARGIEIAAVDSLWHALAAAWDPSAPANTTARPRGGSGSGPVIDAADPITAVVLVDPSGVLSWCWSRAGHVLTAGVQRLRTLEVARAAPVEPLVDDAGSTRRLLDPAQTEPARVAEVCRADAGRLVGEWLAWAAQLGVVPSRIVCIGPADAIATGLGDAADAPAPSSDADGGGLAALGRTLAARWPGASASVVLDDDPIGVTLRRLAEHRPPGVPAETTGVALRDLSSRPGRLSRAMHRWAALALLAAAGFVCVLALRLDWSAKATLEGARQAIDKRQELLRAKEAEFPKLAADPDPVTKLKVALRELQKNREETTPERPVLPVIDRVLSAASGIERLKVKKITVSSLSGVSFDFVVPDPEPGAALLKALREDSRPILQGQSVQVIWEGDTATQTVPVAGMTEPQRVFKLRGIWFDPRAQRPGTQPGGAP